MYEVVEVLYCSNKSNLQIITLNMYFFEIIDSFAIVEPNKSSFRGQINETDNLKNSHVA